MMINSRKPILTMPSTASTRARMILGTFGVNTATAAVHSDSTSDQSNNEPSCEPHTPEIR